MASFRYVVTDSKGHSLPGRINAANVDDARRALELQGLKVIELTSTPDNEQQNLETVPAQLSREEVLEWSRHVARISAANLTLSQGFRAAAEECASKRVAAAMRLLADRIERGQTLENALRQEGTGLPPHVGGLIAAAIRTGKLPAALIELVEFQRTAQQLRRKLTDGLAYPMVVTFLSIILILLLLFYPTNRFEQMFQEFRMQLPFITQLLFWWRDVGIWLFGGLILIAILAAILYRITRGQAAWLRLVASIPLIGRLGHWLGLAEWSKLVGVLIRNDVPLPEALRLSADGVSQAHIREMSLTLAEGVDRGQPITQLLSVVRDFPYAMLPLLKWGEKSGLLSEAFNLGSQMLEKRIEVRSAVIQTLLPPLLFIVIGCFVFLIVGGLFYPLAVLLQGLS